MRLPRDASSSQDGSSALARNPSNDRAEKMMGFASAQPILPASPSPGPLVFGLLLPRLTLPSPMFGVLLLDPRLVVLAARCIFLVAGLDAPCLACARVRCAVAALLVPSLLGA